jgi:hypothetical protein
MNEEKSEPDIEHLKWAIDCRADIQHTLLALYTFVRRPSPDDQRDWVRPSLLDDLIAAAFSLWRAAFLAEHVRTADSIRDAQRRFLATVIATNAINLPDDRKNSAWSVSFYLENAKHRLMRANQVAEHHIGHKSLKTVLSLVRLTGTDDVKLTRYEWECIHRALRIILKVLDPDCNLPIKELTLPTE